MGATNRAFGSSIAPMCMGRGIRGRWWAARLRSSGLGHGRGAAKRGRSISGRRLRVRRGRDAPACECTGVRNRTPGGLAHNAVAWITGSRASSPGCRCRRYGLLDAVRRGAGVGHAAAAGLGARRLARAGARLNPSHDVGGRSSSATAGNTHRRHAISWCHRLRRREVPYEAASQHRKPPGPASRRAKARWWQRYGPQAPAS